MGCLTPRHIPTESDNPFVSVYELVLGCANGVSVRVLTWNPIVVSSIHIIVI